MSADDVARTMASRMAERRGSLRLSLQEVGDRAGMSKSHVWELENGRSRNPTIGTAVAVANALGVSLDYLIGRTNAMPDLHPEALRIACEVDALLRGRSPTPSREDRPCD